MLVTISQVIWHFRQDHALSKLFHCDINFNISSSRTSFRSLKTAKNASQSLAPYIAFDKLQKHIQQKTKRKFSLFVCFTA